MKNKTLSLIKVMFKTEDVMEMSSGKKGKIRQWIKILGLVVLLLIGGFSFAPMIVQLYSLLAKFGMQDIILKLLLFATSLLVVVFGFFLIMNVFYFSSDVENYLYLPVKPGSLVISKFTVVLVYQILSGLTLFYPSFIVYGIVSKAGVAYYLKTFLAMVIVPIVPLALIGVLTLVLMRFSKIFKNKDLFTLLSTGLAIFASIGFSMLMQNFSSSSVGGVLPTFLTGEGTLYKVLSGLFPGTFFMHKAIIGDLAGLLINLLITLAISFAAVALFYFLGNKLYIDGAKGLRETGTKREKLSDKRMSESGRGTSPVFAIAKKDFLILLRTPVYLINCVLLSFIMPLFILMPATFTQMSGKRVSSTPLGIPVEIIREVSTPSWSALIIMIIVAFYSSLNLIPATSISREGRNFQIMKFIPVSYKVQLMGKILPAFLVQIPAMMLIIIPFIVFFKPSPIGILIGLVTGLLMSLLIYMLSMALDVLKPVLNWTSEQKAVKQNFNAALTSILGMVISFTPVIAIFLLKLGALPVIGIYSAVCIILILFLYYKLPVLAEKSFRDR